MNRFFFLFICSLFINVETPAAFSKGPVPYRNQFPLALLFFSFESDSAYIEEKSSLRLEVSYSSIFERGGGDIPDYFVDMEIARTRLEIKRRVSDTLQIEGEVTHVRLGSGFLDPALRTYHKLLGVQVGSADFPDNAYEYSINGRGIHVNFPRPGASFSDSALKIKLNVVKEQFWYPAISIKCGLKLPTGGRNTFSGSGSTDFGISLLMSKRVGKVVGHMNLSSVKIFSPGLSDTKTDSIFYQAFAGLEWVVSSDLSASIQVLSHKYPFSDVGIKGLRNLTLEEVIGFKYSFNSFQLDIAFIEDTSDLNFSPDFSTLVGITFFGT